MNQLTYETLFYDDPDIGPGVALEPQGDRMEPINNIFWDMDGVFADFVGGVVDLLHIEPLSIANNWPAGEYSLEKVLNISTERLWNLINRGGVDWWAHLDPFAWNTELRSLIADCRGSHSILTSPGDCAFAYQGKRLWADRHLSGLPLTLTGNKHLLAKPSTLLIDDHDRNVELFQDAGGRAILFPQHWNRNHDKVGDRIDFVREQLIEFKVL